MKLWLGPAFTLLSMALPFAANADCPTESSIARYVQSTGDAVDVLEGAVLDEQYSELTDRYSAMIIMKWDRLGLNALSDQPKELDRVATCFRTPACGAEQEDPIDTQITSILQQTEVNPFGLTAMLTETPSATMLEWAEITLGCREPEPVSAPIRVSLAEPTEAAPVKTPTTPEPVTPEVLTVSAQTPEPPRRQPSTPAKTVIAAAGTVSTNEPDIASAPLQQACDADLAAGTLSVACENLLEAFKFNVRSAADSDEYLSVADALCRKDYVNACVALANLYRYTGERGAAEKFAGYTARSCELGDADACATESNTYMANAAASEADMKQARVLLQKSCDLGRKASCLEVAEMYVRGVGGPSNTAEAIKVASAACPQAYRGNAEDCVSAAGFVLIHMAPSSERDDKIRSFTERACNNDNAFGCSLYATDLEHGLRGATDPERANLVRRKACRLGDIESCRTRS
ncbi:MAG: tetratricopeptide repeat protein [Pseudomonadota bacterium]